MIKEVSQEETANLKEEVKSAKEVKEGISLVKKYENLLKGANQSTTLSETKESTTLSENKAISSKDLRKRMNFLTVLV